MNEIIKAAKRMGKTDTNKAQAGLEARVECSVPKCSTLTDNEDCFVCAGHWEMVPRKMKRAYWAASSQRAHKRKGPEVYKAAEDIVKYLIRKAPFTIPERKSLIISE